MSFEVIYIDKGYISNICRTQTFELTGFFGIYPLPSLKQREVFINFMIWYCRSTLYTFAQYVIHQNDRVILLSYRQFIISTSVIECYMI